MPNMSYCQFENTFPDLRDCYEDMNRNDLSESEKRYRLKLIKLCIEIADEYRGETEGK